MACKTSYDLHHNFPRLAEETGFAFNTHRPRVHIDWNKIRLIDIESLAKDRKFVLIEQHVNDILDCVLESEFDVRILDEGVVKLFRLAQLAVEYQQFCRHYLDRSVFVLRQEIDTLAQAARAHLHVKESTSAYQEETTAEKKRRKKLESADLAATKKEVQEKEEELRRLRRKGKHNCRPLLPYGNDNIATMILKTLTNKGELFPSPASGEVPQYNKCNYCDKAFLNQLYLKSHISRRHVNALDELTQRIEKEKDQNVVSYNAHENNKLNDEINELKLKIKEMESLISANNKIKNDSEQVNNIQPVVTKVIMKDVEVATNNEHVFEKLEEWKKTEQENHAKEINLLRNQIFETLNSFREKEDKKSDEGELKVIDHLHLTIKEQGTEILALKQALTHSKLKTNSEEKELKKEYEEQILSWTKRDEAHSKKYELLVQKLNEVGKEARESKALAEAERQRAGTLEAMLEERLTNKKRGTNVSNSSTDADAVSSSIEEIKDRNKISNAKTHNKSRPAVDDNTLEKLHRKAQELLNIKSSTSSEASSAENVSNQLKHSFKKKTPDHNNVKPRRTKNYSARTDEDPSFLPSKKLNKLANRSKHSNKHNVVKVPSNKKKEKKPELLQASPNAVTLGNGPLPPGSPLKVVRAKITEEVNSRLVAAGVDPLKNKLHHSVYQKQKTQLQQQLEQKSKKYPAYEQVKYTIMAYLDSDASGAKRDVDFESDNTTANSFNKPFSLSSMISNVKSKALSFVKSKDIKRKSDYNKLSSEITKQRSDLRNTPPGSPVSSNSRRSSPKSPSEKEFDLNSRHNGRTKTIHTNKIINTRIVKNESLPYLVDEVDADSNASVNSSNITIPQRPSRSIDNLIMSPARRPASANAEYKKTSNKYALRNNNNDPPSRTQSVTNVSNLITYRSDNEDLIKPAAAAENDDIEELLNVNKLPKAEDNERNSLKHTKGVLKNASSTLSLYKKKVIFDMDAIQMKSVSASPSQSLTEKSDDKDDLGLNNIGNDEWDISSIENEPINTDTKIHVRSGPTSKIAELKQTIEAQLARRSETPSTVLAGGVDLLRGPIAKAANIGGSNTSLGSSILDDSDSNKVANQRTLIKPRKIAEKDDSELDISDFSTDGVTNKNDRDSF